jgi:hypothetical protein
MSALSVRSAALGFLLWGGFAQPGLAQTDAVAVATAFVGAVEALGDIEVAYDEATSAGDTVTIAGLRVTLPDTVEAVVPALVLSGVAPRDAGGFTAAVVQADGGSATVRGKTLTWATASFADVIVPDQAEVTERQKIRPFRSLAMTGIGINGEGLAAPVEVATANLEVGEIADTTPTGITASATGVRLPASLIGTSIVGVIVGMLNYTEFTADISLDAEYDDVANSAILNELAVDVQTVGKLTAAGTATNFSIRGLSDPDPDAAQAARSAARLQALSVRVDNAGFVERMLAMQAEMLGGTADDVRKQIVDGALPFALSFVKNEEFRTLFRAEIGEFLQDPRSLTLTIAPKEPVPLGQVARTILRAPLTLPDLLAPTVAANEPQPATPEEQLQ